VFETNILEDDLKEIKVSTSKALDGESYNFTAELRAFEVKTFRVQLK
jgi:hypothetical protein